MPRPTRWDGVKRGECADGVYRLELSEPGGPYTAWREVEPSSWTIEAQVMADLPEEGSRPDRTSFGLGCWTGVGGSGFLFMVWADGRVTVYEELPATGLVPFFEQTTPLPAFRLPARLHAGCAGGPDGTTLTLSLNGTAVALPASTRPSGAYSVVGFTAETGGEGATFVFDDFHAERA